MWIPIVAVAALALVPLANCHPTAYKLNEHKVLEADLVPVSSTVIPLPIYQVGYGVHFAGSEKKGAKPTGPTSLITSANKKKYYGKKTRGDEAQESD